MIRRYIWSRLALAGGPVAAISFIYTVQVLANGCLVLIGPSVAARVLFNWLIGPTDLIIYGCFRSLAWLVFVDITGFYGSLWLLVLAGQYR